MREYEQPVMITASTADCSAWQRTKEIPNLPAPLQDLVVDTTGPQPMILAKADIALKTGRGLSYYNPESQRIEIVRPEPRKTISGSLPFNGTSTEIPTE